MSNNIFGYEWDQIRRAQQGDSRALRHQLAKADTPAEMKTKLESEMKRFGSHVHRDVADAYKVEIPSGYQLDGDTWKPISLDNSDKATH